MATCSAIEHPCLAPSWGCCECRTLNGNHRAECKQCGHARCDKASVIMVPIKEEGGVRIVPMDMRIPTNPDKIN